MNAAGTDAKMRNTKESILEAQFTSGAGNWCTWMFGWSRKLGITISRGEMGDSTIRISAFKQEGDEVRFKESIVYYDCNGATIIRLIPIRSCITPTLPTAVLSSIVMLMSCCWKQKRWLRADMPDLEGAADIIDEVRDRAKLGSTSTLSVQTKTSCWMPYLKNVG